MPYTDLTTGILHVDAEITYENSVSFLSVLRHMDGHAASDSLTVHVMCHGGALMPAIAIAQALRTCKKPVSTIGVGYVASGAVLALAAGTPGKRHLIEGSKILLHEPVTHMTPVSRKGPGLGVWENEVAIERDMFSGCYWMLARCSKRPESFWRELLESKPDRLLTVEEALEFGIIDTVVSLG